MHYKALLLTLVLALATACSCSSNQPQALYSPAPVSAHPFDHSHQDLTDVLALAVVKARVNYVHLKAQTEPLDGYLAQLESVKLAEFKAWNREQRFAFWINAYNAYILRLVRDNHPLESIRDLGGNLFGRVWDHELIPLGHLAPSLEQELISFGQLEHEILRPNFQDARVHAAINCASESCPPLQAVAFRAVELEAQLELTMGKFVRNERLNQFDQTDQAIRLSSIFDWFSEDFEHDAGSAKAFVQRYLGDRDTTWIPAASQGYLDYSWDLNEAP